MRRLTLLLQLDAFRPDYLRHAPYLRSLAGETISQLREPFGFLPHGAYFGGLTPEQIGFSNMYTYDPGRSPFGIARALDTTRISAAAFQELGAREMIDRSARAKVRPYGRSYVSSGRIPLNLLPCFTLVEQDAPWDRGAGYRSIFHDLDARGEAWFECSWPGTNTLPDHSDRGIVAEALRRASPDCRFGFVHLQELDACGHWHGPDSPETRDCVIATDRLAAELIEALRSSWDAVDLLMFGDHGMVSVTRTEDVAATLSRLPLRRGHDYTYFLDSTMARVWLHTESARARLPSALARVPGARLLTQADLRRYQMERCDHRNGELILLAEPGVVFQPNFFQEDGVLRGMHGYDPDCVDNRGVFIYHSDRLSVPPGIVDATELYGLMRRLLFEQAGERREVVVPARPRFTQWNEPAADAFVERQLETIVEAVVAEIGEPRAIVLTGSFGRGEGGVVRQEDEFVAVNDFDILVVDDVDRSSALDGLRENLARRLGVDFVDLGWTDGRWERWHASLSNFDLKYGSTVIHGDTGVMEVLPAFAAAEIPLLEGLQLLLNRMAGVLSGMSAESSEGERYLTNQYVKAVVALGDTYLLEWKCYDSSYVARARRFSALADGAGVPREVIEGVARAYELKIRPDYAAIPDVRAAIRLLIPVLCDRARELVARCGSGTVPATLEAAMSEYLVLPIVTNAVEDNERLVAKRDVRALFKETPPDTSMRQLVYSTLPLVLAAGCRTESPDCVPSSWEAASWLDVPGRVDGWPAWQELRGRVVSAWLATIH